MTLPQAIAEPRANQRNTASVQWEPAFDPGQKAALTATQHAFAENPTPDIGAATTVTWRSLPLALRQAISKRSTRRALALLACSCTRAASERVPPSGATTREASWASTSKAARAVAPR